MGALVTALDAVRDMAFQRRRAPAPLGADSATDRS